MVIAALVAVCGGLGAVSRFGLDAFVQAQVLGAYPLGTLIVNLSGSALLGLLAGLHASHDLQLVAGTATLGSYTTFSTWMFEAHRAGEDGQTRLAWWSVAVAVLAGVLAAALGRTLGEAL